MMRPLLCFCLFIVPAVYCGFTYQELWPFSRYSMYASPLILTAKDNYRLYIVTQEGTSKLLKGPLLWPLDLLRTNFKIRKYASSPDAAGRIRKVLLYYASRIRQINRRSPDGKFQKWEKIQLRQMNGVFQIENGRSKFKFSDFKIIDEVKIFE